MMYQADEKRYETMQYNRCGKSGLLLPKVSLGLWHNFGSNGDYDNMKAMCFTAFDHGITHFDLANNYGPEPGNAEINFGRILKEDLGAYRDEMLISTKAGFDMWDGPYGNWGSKKYLTASLDQSLKRMGLEYVDIFYHHRMDPETPLEETMETLAQIVRSGKALYVGISNYDGVHMEKAAESGKGIIAFSPLAQGTLTNRYLNGIPSDSRIATDGRFLKASQLTEEKITSIRGLNEIAKERGESLAQMALNWVLKDGIVTSVLVGASKPEQILDNLKVLESAPFTDEELKKIDALSLVHAK